MTDINYMNDLKVEVQVPTPGLQNLIKNPNGEQGGWGWITPVANTTMQRVNIFSDGPALQFATSTAQALRFESEFLPMTASWYAVTQLRIKAISTSHGLTFRYDWYNSSKVFISSSTATAQTTGTGVKYGVATQAPANTAYAKLVVNLYGNAGSTPISSAFVQFDNAMVAKSSTSTGFGSIRENLIPDPGVVNVATDYWEPVPGFINVDITRATSPVFNGTTSLRLSTTNPSGYWVQAQSKVDLPVTAGQHYTASTHIRSASGSRNWYIGIRWRVNGTWGATYNAGGAFGNSSTSWTRMSTTLLAPAGADMAKVVVYADGQLPVNEYHYFDGFMLEKTNVLGNYFDGATAASGGVTYTWSGTPNASKSLATTASASFDYQPPYAWLPITGSVTSLNIGREAMNLGTMSVTLKDENLDPAGTNKTLTPGKQVRVQARDGAVWKNLYYGKINNAVVDYEKKKIGNVPERIHNTNHIYNPSSNDGTTNLWISYGTGTALASVIEDGRRAFQVTKPSGSGNQGASTTGLQNIPAGTVITASVWCKWKNHNGTPKGIGMVFRDNTNNDSAVLTNVSAGSINHSVPDDGQWHRIYVTGTIKAARNLERFYVSLNDLVVGSDDALLFRDAMITTGPLLVDFFDGNTTSTTTDKYRWTGTAYASASQHYHPAKTTAAEGTISITGVDGMADLANQGESRSVATIAELPYILEGKGVPWNCAGITSHITTATIPVTNDNLSIADQIVLTRDSARGLAWIDKDGVLQVQSNPSSPIAEWGITDYAAETTNYWPNGDLESANMAMWAAGNAGTTIARSTAAARSGTNGLRVTANGVDNAWVKPANDATPFQGEFTMPSPGTYEVSIWIRSSAGFSFQDGFEFNYYTNQPANTWVQFKFQVDAYKGSTSGLYHLYCPELDFYNASGAKAAAGQTFDLDDMTITRMPVHANHSEIDTEWNTDKIMNQVELKHLRPNLDGTAEEVVMGTYENTTSVTTYGPKKATFTLVGSSINFATYASSILSANATPKVKANSVRIPIKDTSNMAFATGIDLCDYVYVQFDTKVATTYRVHTISHSVDASGWYIDLTFDTATSNPAPQRVDPPPVDVANLTDTGWIYPTLNPGWAQYNGGYTNARYRRKDGIVYLQGLVASGAGTIFTLPAKFRPAGGTLIFAPQSAGTTTRIDVDVAGNVTFMAGNNGYVSLVGIQFPADA